MGKLSGPAVVIAPMGDKHADEEPTEKPDEMDDSDGARESFDELADALDLPEDKREAVFSALKGLIDQRVYKCMGEDDDK